MGEAVAVVAGRRGAVHRLPDDPERSGRCHSLETDEDPREIDAAEFAAIAQAEPRRLCGHDYPTRDRAKKE